MGKHIVVIPGDGIGAEITTQAQRVLRKVSDKYRLGLTYEEHPAGGAAIDKCGVPLPDTTVAAAQKADAVLLGAVGGPAWDNVAPELRPERAILGLRKALKLYANLRPVKVSDTLAGYSPLKPDIVTGVDILIVRELIGGIYFGDKGQGRRADGMEEAWDTERYSVPEVRRIVSTAFQMANLRHKKVTSVDKANVLFTSRLWRRTAGEVAKEFGGISFDSLYVDNCAMQLVVAPKNFDVIVTSNLFGDILSDEAAVLTGSIGMLPSASIGEGTGLYEPIHGSAPDIAGKGIANPIGTILSAAMMLRYSFREGAAADAIESAVEKVLADGYRTADLYREGLTRLSTDEMGSKIEASI